MSTPKRKRCSKCGKRRAVSQFGSNKSKKDGLQYKCKDCTRIYQFNYLLGYRYGIDRAEFDRMLREQVGRCAICATPMTDPFVDHCHAEGHVRGLLCSMCNTGLGYFRDDTDSLVSAIVYLAA